MRDFATSSFVYLDCLDILPGTDHSAISTFLAPELLRLLADVSLCLPPCNAPAVLPLLPRSLYRARW